MTYSIVIEKCKETNFYVGHIPGFPGAHSQGVTIEELRQNMIEVVELLVYEGYPELESEFIGTQELVIE